MERLHLSYEELNSTLHRVFLKCNFTEEKAAILAKAHSESTQDGIESHGINRVIPFLENVERGIVKIDKEAEKAATYGNMEQWDGHFGPGVINALKCTERAIEMAKANGIGFVALRNTNHWMRGGTYGWKAADEGCISLLFTNTEPNMPAWGGKYSRIGNNPLVVSIPRSEGHVVLDMAISQFSFGKINDYRLRGEQLPVHGGWDDQHELSKDPEIILKKERGLPIGYWKGSALSMILDMLATLLSEGDSTSIISTREHETGISQVYLCIYPALFGDGELQEKLLNDIISYTQDVEPMQEGERTYYPGERTLLTRKKNLKEGVPVNKEVWLGILERL